jgi:SH2 domain.
MSASQEDLRAPWMWDQLSRDDAVAKLEGKPEGTFLARPGSQPNTWSFTMVTDGRVMHVRTIRKGGGFCLGNASAAPRPSLTALVVAKMRAGVFGTPLANPRKQAASGSGSGSVRQGGGQGGQSDKERIADLERRLEE